MRFEATPLPGVTLIHLTPHGDERGFFSRTWCRDEYAAAGLCPDLAQSSLSYNRQKGTLRGLHYQRQPLGEAKTIRCLRGRAFDVAVDLRPDSPAYGRWFSVELSAANRLAIHLPPGVAHGFQTLEDDTELFYEISVPFHAESSTGIRWDDPTLAIPWPLADPVMSERDRCLPLLAHATGD